MPVAAVRRRGSPCPNRLKMIELAQADIVGLQEIGDNVPKLAEITGLEP